MSRIATMPTSNPFDAVVTEAINVAATKDDDGWKLDDIDLQQRATPSLVAGGFLPGPPCDC